jgi:PAS domain-containing protein
MSCPTPTERKRAEIELHRVAGDLTRLIDTANAPIFGIDKNGLVNEWNQTAARITGYSKKEVLGTDLVERCIIGNSASPTACL